MNVKDYMKNGARYMLMSFFYHIRNRNKKSVYFASFSGTQYSDSPRAVSEMLHDMDSSIELVWCLPDKLIGRVPNYIKIVKPQSIESIRMQSQAKAWVFNGVIQLGTYKGKETFYVQTWHGDRAFKQIGHDAYAAMGNKKYHGYVKYVEPQICDLFTVASVFGKNMIKSAFGYNRDFLDVGIPRNDILVNVRDHQERAHKVKKALKIDDDAHILMFAPTFRDNSKEKQSALVDLSKCLDILESKGEKWICLVRAHALSLGVDFDHNSDRRLINATDYLDMAELLLITDCLITDYSSSAQDFILTDRPVILAQYDIDEYSSKSRALYYDPMISGFLIAHNQTELNSILQKINDYDHKQISQRVQEFYGMHESGTATYEVCKKIKDWCNKK